MICLDILNTFGKLNQRVEKFFVDVPKISCLKLPEVEARADTSGGEMLLLFIFLGGKGGDENQKLETHFDVNHILPTKRKGFSIAGRCSLFFFSRKRMMAKRVEKGRCCSLLSDGDL